MKPTRYIAKCRCKTVTSAMVTEPEFRAATEAYGWPKSRPMPTGSFRIHLGSQCLVCRGCGAIRIASPVVGRVSKHECGARCMGSTSGKCECSCGGQNHGSSHAA